MADAGTLPVARQGLSRVEMSQELPRAGPEAQCACQTCRVPGVGRLPVPVRTHMNNPNDEILAAVPSEGWTFRSSHSVPPVSS